MSVPARPDPDPDPVVAVAALRPDLFDWEQRSVRCETSGLVTMGHTVVDRRSRQTGPVAVTVVMDVYALRSLVIDAVIAGDAKIVWRSGILTRWRSVAPA